MPGPDETDLDPADHLLRRPDADGWHPMGHAPDFHEVEAHIARAFGPCRTLLTEPLSQGVRLDVYVIPPSPGRDFTVYVTGGMSDRPMTAPAGMADWTRVELVVALPGPPEAHFGPNGEAPALVRAMKNLARFVHDTGAWLYFGATFSLSDMVAPATADAPVDAFIVHGPSATPILPLKAAFEGRLSNGEAVRVFALIPIQRDELAHKLAHGGDDLLLRLERAGVTEVFDPARPSVIQPRRRPLPHAPGSRNVRTRAALGEGETTMAGPETLDDDLEMAALVADGWGPMEHAPFNPEVEAHIARCFGEAQSVRREPISKWVRVDLHVIPPRPGRDFTVYVTSGMSDRPMSPPPGAPDFRRIELVIALPGPPEAHLGPGGEPHELLSALKQQARHPHETGAWLFWGHTVASRLPGEPVDPDAPMDAVVLGAPSATPITALPGEAFECRLSNGEAVCFLAMIPIHRDELKFGLAQGGKALVERLEGAGVTEVFDPARPSVVPPRRRGFDWKRLLGRPTSPDGRG